MARKRVKKKKAQAISVGDRKFASILLKRLELVRVELNIMAHNPENSNIYSLLILFLNTKGNKSVSLLTEKLKEVRRTVGKTDSTEANHNLYNSLDAFIQRNNL